VKNIFDKFINYKWILATTAIIALAVWGIFGLTKHSGQSTVATAPFSRLMEGNTRFAAGHPMHPDEKPDYRKSLAKAQHPYAIVVACSDSRLSPELIFDQGLGDLFVIRTAGNLISDMELGSIEYAVEHLGATTIIVLGHEHCGAIEALMNNETPHGHIKTIIDSLKHEIEIKSALVSHDVHAAVIANIHHQVQSIITDPLIIELSRKYPIDVKGALYSLETGQVHPLESIMVMKK